mmetsp:Transcript_16067/g.27112  ORF Transcript_16067/g.27112 Transcript_16067/m.27112 type:complete len:154 (-) Transcript_16067:1229-1690(-)
MLDDKVSKNLFENAKFHVNKAADGQARDKSGVAASTPSQQNRQAGSLLGNMNVNTNAILQSKNSGVNPSFNLQAIEQQLIKNKLKMAPSQGAKAGVPPSHDLRRNDSQGRGIEAGIGAGGGIGIHRPSQSNGLSSKKAGGIPISKRLVAGGGQ